MFAGSELFAEQDPARRRWGRYADDGGARSACDGVTLATGQAGRDGYTLIELVIVVGLIAILAALAATNLAGLQGRFRMNAAAQELAKRLNHCRVQAVTENGVCGVFLLGADPSLDTGSWTDNVGSYEVRTYVPGPEGTGAWEPLGGDARVDLGSGPGEQEGVSIEGWTPLQGAVGYDAQDAIVFTSRGYPANESSDFPNGLVSIVLRNRAASFVERRVVLVDRGGNVTIASDIQEAP